MRSSVSYILSTTTTEPNMSHPDYEQYSHDHAALLVLVKHVGSLLKPKTYNKFYDRISKISNVKITDSTGQVRLITIRHVKDYPIENNDWGDFQTHRRLLGLISIAKYDTQTELNEICRVHESLKVKYTNTLFDSRCVFFGPLKEVASPTDSNSSSEGTSVSEAMQQQAEIEMFTTPSNFKTRALFYDENSTCSSLETQVTEFINSLFWVLESKRMERSREKLERVSLLLAPFEKKDFVGLDMESRNNKKRCTGRMTKHLGDLCLQAGLLSESLMYYTSAAETLKSINDWLWLGASYEGLCTSSAIILYPNMQRNLILHRNASLQEGSPRRASTVTSGQALELEMSRKSTPNLLTPDDISKRYREAIIHYSKYQNAGIVETEASFKAARIAIAQHHALQAASFLQNVVYINLSLSEQEKIQRFEMLAELYSQIGFSRKAAFCLRLAATRYVSPQNPQPNWGQCYALMLNSLPGHKLSLDPSEMSGQGWPALQVQLLQELVVAAKRTGNSALATRHMTFLLQTMWQHLSLQEQKEFAVQLQSLSAQCEGSPVPLVLDNGAVIPPANLINIPLCTAFSPRTLQPHLRPRLINEPPKEDSGPFLFTPIHFGSLERQQPKSLTKMDFLWVQEDVCEIELKLINPLPFELKVSDMRLLTSGVVFESIPETVILPSDTPTVVTLVGAPKESGELDLQGYSTHALGVKSNCRLRHMENLPPNCSIEVVPGLPQLKISTSLPESATFSSLQSSDSVVTSASLSLHNGESQDLIVTLSNIGHIPVEMVQISIESLLDLQVQEQMFTWNEEELKQQLPILPSNSASFTVHITAVATFISPPEPAPSSFMSMSAGPSSLPSRLNSPMSGSFHARRSDINSSFRSSNSGQSSACTVALPQQSGLLEGHLQLQYSGGAGQEAGYCRLCSVFLTVETLPSLRVTHWDVLPAETASHFYLVLDIANLTPQEMELHYYPGRSMHVEGQESCRVPVPVPRCPLSKLTRFYLEQHAGGGCTGLDLDQICAEHVAKQVDLKWHLLGTDAKGSATVKGITVTSKMLDIVRMSPLLWDVSVNGENIKPQEEINCTAGECLKIETVVTNSLENALNQLTLSVQFYQDYENGTLNYRLDTRIVTAGLTKKILSSLEPNKQGKHVCNVIFLTSGHYKIDIQCVAPENLVSACLPGSGHIWRLIPPVSVIVS